MKESNIIIFDESYGNESDDLNDSQASTVILSDSNDEDDNIGHRRQ